jgi:hypothetical protein
MSGNFGLRQILRLKAAHPSRATHAVPERIDELRVYCRKRADVDELLMREVGAAPEHVGRGHRSSITTPNQRGATYVAGEKRTGRDGKGCQAWTVAAALAHEIPSTARLPCPAEVFIWKSLGQAIP